jgi:hypothetical protein
MGKVVRVDAERRTVILVDGTGGLLMMHSCGDRFTWQVSCPSEGIENVSVLRTLSDATYLNEHMQDTVCVLGGGLLERWVCGTRHPKEQPLHRRDIRRGDRHIKFCSFLSYQFNVQTYQQTGENGITQTLTGVTNNSLVFALVG